MPGGPQLPDRGERRQVAQVVSGEQDRPAAPFGNEAGQGGALVGTAGTEFQHQPPWFQLQPGPAGQPGERVGHLV